MFIQSNEAHKHVLCRADWKGCGACNKIHTIIVTVLLNYCTNIQMLTADNSSTEILQNSDIILSEDTNS